uniref:Uncharacterized protein n=1 Tax=Fervidobacterium thailandense TaxID=1008305 RepID=A0A7C5VJU4_9BACT
MYGRYIFEMGNADDVMNNPQCTVVALFNHDVFTLKKLSREQLPEIVQFAPDCFVHILRLTR